MTSPPTPSAEPGAPVMRTIAPVAADAGAERRRVDADIASISRISAVPTILRVVSEVTGLRLALVARAAGGCHSWWTS